MFHHSHADTHLIALDAERFPAVRFMPEPAFENAEYRVRITHTLGTDKRIMSFVNYLWGFEVTGGYDQWEPLTIVDVKRSGYAFRAGMRLNDRIVRINRTFAGTLTLREAQLLIRRSGKNIKIYVQGNEDPVEDDEFTVDYWFKLPRQVLEVEDQWNDCFPWNDRNKRRYRESNCFRVPSKVEERFYRATPIIVEPPLENSVEDACAPNRSVSRSPSRGRSPFIPIEDEHNQVIRALTPNRDGSSPHRGASPNRTVHTFLLVK